MYTAQELGEGWEFKILRANTRAFKHPDKLKHACDEEGQNGWVLLEKLDDSRLRFKRPRKAGGTASAGAIDPYRSHYGMDPTSLAIVIVASVIATHYDDTRWVPMVSYGIAGLVGVERIASDNHWLSDVLAGALIGTLVGREVVVFNRERHRAGNFRLSGDGQSIVLAWEW